MSEKLAKEPDHEWFDEVMRRARNTVTFNALFPNKTSSPEYSPRKVKK